MKLGSSSEEVGTGHSEALTGRSFCLLYICLIFPECLLPPAPAAPWTGSHCRARLLLCLLPQAVSLGSQRLRLPPLWSPSQSHLGESCFTLAPNSAFPFLLSLLIAGITWRTAVRPGPVNCLPPHGKAHASCREFCVVRSLPCPQHLGPPSQHLLSEEGASQCPLPRGP